MRRILIFLFGSFIVFGYFTPLLAQDRYDGNETSVNLFRNPSMGIEKRVDQISIHIGFYPTVVSKNAEGKNENTSFIKVGMSFWYLPWGDKLIPSSLFSTFSFVHGLSRSYKGQNGFMVETGSRVMIEDHFNFRLGAALLKAKEHPWKLNPTPGLSYSFIAKHR